jgi:hypothetical protein
MSHLVSSEPFRNNNNNNINNININIRHLSLLLYMAFDDVVYAHFPYAFQLEALHALDLVLPGLRTVDIFLAPSPQLQRPPGRRHHVTHFKLGIVDTAGKKAAKPDLLELGNKLHGIQGVVGRYDG